MHNTAPLELLGTRDAAAYCGVEHVWLRKLASKGRGPRIAVPGRKGRYCGHLYDPRDLDAWVAGGRGYNSGLVAG